MTYRVKLTASHENTEFIGYHQSYDAYDQNGTWCGGVGKSASCFAHKSQVEGSENFRVILDRLVEAKTPYQACRKLEEWQTQGKPDAWLLQVTP